MAKSQGRRGARGIPGPPGRPGKTGATGATGKTGHIGDTGATGAAGATGARGAVGASGPGGAIADQGRVAALNIIKGQIENIYHELDVQLRRMAQLQMEVDKVRTTLARLAGES